MRSFSPLTSPSLNRVKNRPIVTSPPSPGALQAQLTGPSYCARRRTETTLLWYAQLRHIIPITDMIGPRLIGLEHPCEG